MVASNFMQQQPPNAGALTWLADAAVFEKQDAAPWDGEKRNHYSRAMTGPRPQALGPAARSSLMVCDTCASRKAAKKRGPSVVKTPLCGATPFC